MDPDALPKLHSLIFPVQIAKANPDYDPQGRSDGTNLEFFVAFARTETEFAVKASVRSVDDQSPNLPYSLEFEVQAVFEGTSVPEPPPDSARALVAGVAIGALRTRISDVTSQGPWPRFLVPVLNLRQNSLDASAEPMVPSE